MASPSYIGAGNSSSWIAALAEPARQRVYGAMRSLGECAEIEWSKARSLSPRQGERPAGSAGFDHVFRASMIEDFLSALREGASPEISADKARAFSRQYIERHNDRCPDDDTFLAGWKRDAESGQAYIEMCAAKIWAAVGQVDLTPATATLVWAALWRQMDALQEEWGKVYFERRLISDIEADFLSLIDVIKSVRHISRTVSESTLVQMVTDYGDATLWQRSMEG